MSTKEDLIISKLSWYNISQSERQLEDLKFLLLDADLDLQYIKSWTNHLKLKSYGKNNPTAQPLSSPVSAPLAAQAAKSRSLLADG